MVCMVQLPENPGGKVLRKGIVVYASNNPSVKYHPKIIYYKNKNNIQIH